jgi:hypothetical protein
LAGKFFTLQEISIIIKYLYALDAISSDLMEVFISYLVEQGYDAEDFANILGVSKASSLIHRLCIGEPDKITNNNFLVHVEEFIRENLKQFTKL